MVARMESQQSQTNEILRAMSERMDRQDARMDRQDTRMDRLESKLDRLPWFGLTVAAGLLASVVVGYFVG